MYNISRSWLLRWLKVPAEPHPPFGDPASLRVFRAGKNYFNLRLAAWGLGELIALAGIIFWVVVFVQIEDAVRLQRQNQSAPRPQSIDAAVANIKATTIPPPTKGKGAKSHQRIGPWAGFKQLLVVIAIQLPDWAFPVLWTLKVIGFVVYLVQIPFTYAIRRMDYEMRWYVVTDRSLRIRTGVWSVQELTMSFANLQQVVVTQGPLQRLLGLGDVLVQSAGGGESRQSQQPGRASLHLGHFHGVDNATEIRDLILERLRRFRETGLGDPEEVRAGAALPALAPPVRSAALAAAHALRDEARALRAALG